MWQKVRVIINMILGIEAGEGSAEPFVFGASFPSTSQSRPLRKWRKAARVPTRYSFDFLGPQTNFKAGRKRTQGHGLVDSMAMGAKGSREKDNDLGTRLGASTQGNKDAILGASSNALDVAAGLNDSAQARVWSFTAPWIQVCLDEWGIVDDFWHQLMKRAASLGQFDLVLVIFCLTLELQTKLVKTADLKEKGADPYDLKQHENVLAESRMMIPDCHKRMKRKAQNSKMLAAPYQGEEEGVIASSEVYSKHLKDGTGHWQEDIEEYARAELWREELIEEIEQKVGGLRESEKLAANRSFLC
ncbi:Tubulin binding cofactor A [Corchorus olitorius]|uniref:Tubulin binding cofactor A n=1 Tax=Corchorus olitorius TaxID=93759 RepID=A0A1R3HLN6_9ROSI|nr:Tubulin binding cofactor A [Corchorus olitorius]